MQWERGYLLYWPRSAFSIDNRCRIQLALKLLWPRVTGTKSLDQGLKIAGRRAGYNNSPHCKAGVP